MTQRFAASPATPAGPAEARISVALHGIGVSAGIATGPLVRLAPPPVLPPVTSAAEPERDPTEQLAAARAALEEVAVDLEQRGKAAGKDAGAVLTAQAMMARDPVLDGKIAAKILDGLPAPHAVDAAFGEFRAMLEQAGPYLAERAADLIDVSNRTVARLLGLPMPGIPDPGHPFVLAAHDLAPADTATLDTGRVLAIVTEIGGPTSHTAVISKSLGLPAVVSCPGIDGIAEGETLLVNGREGNVIVRPDTEQVTEQLSLMAARRRAATAVSGPGRTSDGVGVKLLVNVGAGRYIASAASVDAEGVGLFRTEFLFLDRRDEPGIDEQRDHYRDLFEAFSGRKVVVRTLDAGADKPLAFMHMPDEENPALGMRGLRTARRQPELLTTQLRAIARAAAGSGADVWVMAPMVATPAEAEAFVGLAHLEGLPVAGAMIEIPAAALRAGVLLAHCDFVSIGTNDLTQYTFAADRLSGELADLLDPWQPALLELVRITAEAGQASGKSVSVCGEAASDPHLALVLVGLGVTSLSMAPPAVAEVRLALSKHTMIECRELAAQALHATDALEARAAVQARAH